MDKPSGSVPEQVQQFAPKPKPRKDGLTDDLRGLLQRAAGIVSNERSRRAHSTKDQNSGSNADFAPKLAAKDNPIDEPLHDPIDKAGHGVIALLSKAASISNEERERAAALADDIARKLRATEKRIQELEAEASHFRDRAARAEEWMQRISREIESKFIAPERASQLNRRTPDQAAT